MKILTRGLVLLFLIVLVGCEEDPSKPDDVGNVLKGEHQLRKMFIVQEKEGSTSESFFLIWGSVSGESQETANVKFAWQMSDGTYALSSLPLEKFRVKFDNNKGIPTIQFDWRRDCRDVSNIQKILDERVNYVVITCKENDWPAKIQLPMN